MNFTEPMIEAIKNRGKIETRRIANDNPNSPYFRGQCGFLLNRDYAICPGRTDPSIGRLRISATPSLHPVEDITQLGAQREGFETRAAFIDYFLKLHPKLDLSTEVWAIRFEVIAWK